MATRVAAKNTAAIRVGRLLEIRIDAGYRSVAEVDDLFDAIFAEVGKLPASQRVVAVADWRRCPLMSSEASERALHRITLNNPRTLRSAALTSSESPLAVLQFMRLVRESGLPDRKVFQDPAELTTWLQEVLSPSESARLRQFVALRD